MRDLKDIKQKQNRFFLSITALIAVSAFIGWSLMFGNTQNMHVGLLKGRMHYKIVEVKEKTSLNDKHFYSYLAVDSKGDTAQGVFLAHKKKLLGVWVEVIGGKQTDFY